MRHRSWFLAPLVLALVVMGVVRPGVTTPAPPSIADARPASPAEGTLQRIDAPATGSEAVAPARARSLTGEAARSRTVVPTPVWSTIVLLLAALLALVRGATVRWDAVRDLASRRAGSGRSCARATRAPPVAGTLLPAA